VVFSLGEPRHRYYAALFRAADGLAADVRVRTSGYPSSSASDRRVSAPLPPNVTLLPQLSYALLREHYAQASVVALPVSDVIYPAGLTALLEAMSMARPVVVTRSRGLRDYVVAGETALLVEPGDSAGLRDGIRRLLADPALARRLGENARARVEADLNQVRYIERLAALLAEPPAPGIGLAA
jgi:glycosyltransferase involved in cell wall biosynthesis